MNFSDIFDRISSDKIKERTDGVSRFRDLLTSSRQLNALNAERSHSWLQTYQTIFGLVITERNASLAKPSAVANKRLEDVTNLVRMLVEKTHLWLNKKTIKSIINHLSQSVVIGGKLQSYTVTYVRSLRTLLNYSPHLEHLDEKQWLDMLTMCFSGVLGDKIVIGQEFADEQAMEVDEEEERPGPFRRTIEDDEDDSFSINNGSTIRKTATPEDIELVSLIEVLLRSKSAPILLHSSIIFLKFVRFFSFFPNETSAHLNALIALNHAFRELELNDLKAMKNLGRKLWKGIISYWGTKNAELKEQLVISFRYLFPFVSKGLVHLSTTTSSSLTPLLENILNEPNIRWRDGFGELSLDHLRLGLIKTPPPTSKKRAFEKRIFALGVGFDAKHALAWMLVELGADTLFGLWEVSEEEIGVDRDADEDGRMDGGRGKRRKIEDPITSFLDSFKEDTATPNVLIFKLQILLFLVTNHWSSFHDELCSKILQSCIDLLQWNDDGGVQTWSFLVCASVGVEEWPKKEGLSQFGVGADWKGKGKANDSPRKRIDSSSSTTMDPYEQLWQIAMRRLHNPVLCRSACHLANILLEFERVPMNVVNESIGKITTELDFQGPNFPSETVCTFLGWCLALVGSDLRMSDSRFADKVYTWLSSAWKPLDGVVRVHAFGSTRPRSDPFSPGDLATLIARMVGLEKIPTFPFDTTYPDCPAATTSIEMAETSPVRDYIRGIVPAYSLENWTPPIDKISALLGSDVKKQDGLDRRVSAWLEKMVNELIATGADLGANYWTTMSEDMARRHLDIAVTTLIVEGILELNKAIVRKPAVKAAVDLIESVLPLLTHQKFDSTVRASLLSGLSPLFVALPPDSANDYPVFLDPGIASGLPRHLIPQRPAQATSVDFDSLEVTLLRIVWEQEPVKILFTSLSNSLLHIIGGVDNPPPAPTPATQGTSSQRVVDGNRAGVDLDFGEVKVAGSKLIGNGSAKERADAACISSAIRGLISIAMAETGSNKVARVQEIVDAIVQSDGKESLLLVEQTCEALSAGLINLGLGGASSILDHLGGDLLPEYANARDERFHVAALRFLECTATVWVDPPEAGDDFGSRARQLCAFYTRVLQTRILFSWKARIRLMALCDTYLGIDRTQELWTKGDVAHKNAEGNAILPTSMIPIMLADQDFRVRFRSTSSSARIFTFMRENGFDEGPLFQDIRSNVPTNMSDWEPVLTTILVSANTAIASGSRRRAPLCLLIDIASYVPIATPQVRACLAGVAQRIGLGTVTDLYGSIARTNAFRQFPSSKTPITLTDDVPFEAFGFSSLREMRQLDIKLIGPVLNGYRHFTFFDGTCNLLHRPPQQLALECLSGSLALVILRHKSREGPATDEDVVRGVTEQLERAGAKDDYQGDAIFKTITDEVMVEIIKTLHEPAGMAGFLDSLKSDPKTLATFETLMATCPDLQTYKPTPPQFSTKEVNRACSWVQKMHSTLNNLPSLYSVIVQLLTEVHRAPFVPQQHYALIRVVLALSHGYRLASDPSILAAVADSLVLLLRKPDLFSFVAGILDWTFTAWLEIVVEHAGSRTELRRMLVRAAQALDAMEGEEFDSTHPKVEGFGDFLEDCISRSCQLEGTTVDETLLLSPQDALKNGDYSLQNVETALSSSFGHVAKFDMIRAVHERGGVANGSMVWRLMESLPPSDLPSIEDSTTLAELLYETHGEVSPPGLEGALKTSAQVANDDTSLKGVIAGQLIDNFRRESSVDLSLLADVLRSLFAVDAPDAPFAKEVRPSRSLAMSKLFSAPQLIRPFRVRAGTKQTLDELTLDDWVQRATSYDSWARSLALLLADARGAEDPFYAQLPPLLNDSTFISTQLLPSLVHAVLLAETEDPEEPCRARLSHYFTQILQAPATHIECTRSIVEIAVHLRRCDKPVVTLGLTSYDDWLSVPWILLSQAAADTGAHLTSLLFLELAHEYDDLFTSKSNAELDGQGQALFYRAYEHIDEVDGFYGRQGGEVMDVLVRRYRHEDRWNEAFCVYGADYEGPSSRLGQAASMPVTGGVVQSLASFGLNRLAQTILQWTRSQAEIPDDALTPGLPYDLAWRTDNWDLPVEKKSEPTSSAATYSALRAVHAHRDGTSLKATVLSTLRTETAKLSAVTVDMPTPKTTAVAAILSLREIWKWSDVNVQEELEKPALWLSLPQVSPSLPFEYAERVLATRISLLRSVRSQELAEEVGDIGSSLYKKATQTEQACLLELGIAARHAGRLQASMNFVTLANKLSDHDDSSTRVNEELANILWAQREHSTAISLLNSVKPTTRGQQAVVLARLGTWTAEARLKDPREILDKYFEEAVNSLDATVDGKERGDAHAAFATFADAQYEELEQQVSEKRARFSSYKRRKEVELNEIERLISSSQQQSARRSQLEKGQREGRAHLEEDEQQLREAEDTTRLMLLKALENYGRALEASELNDDKVYRFCALWLAYAADGDLHDGLKDLLNQIPSYKFVPLAYQLSARLTKDDHEPSPFAKNVSRLIVRLVSDHPFHTFFPVNTLRGYSEPPAPANARSRRSSTQDSVLPSQTSRARAAEHVFGKVKRITRLTLRIAALETACDAYREWALWDVKSSSDYSVNRKFKGGNQIIKKETKLRQRVKDLAIPVSTYDLPVDKTCAYPDGSFPSIVKYLDHFTIPGGITQPKKVTCVGSNGVNYLQLMKGNDPCRQDAVMEQAFELVNSLLAADEQTRRRRLHIRTYKVIPLQSQSGLIEFVEHTKSLSECIVPLYKSHRAKDSISLEEARRKVKEAAEPRDTKGDPTAFRERRIAVFKTVMSRFPPVMRHLFFKHKSPSLWFDMRLNYSRSTATTSIIGHIMGLGDRHVSNILMDEAHGDLVPIDFGIAFDQGKRLTVPETVPFRLTHNLVDGFGMTGVEGVFRRCAEQTFRVLRERSTVLMTVLQVFKHDPLQTWAITAELARSIQGLDSDGEVIALDDQPDEADRALSIIADKLSTHLSVEYTVNQLIQEATNLDNLGVIFTGWQAYL